MAGDTEARTGTLNIDGGFFQKRCAEEFRHGTGWRVLAEEYPVSMPSGAGASERVESAIDIIAAVHSRSQVGAIVSVECKKANPVFKEWVFFRKHGEHHRFRNLVVRAVNGGGAALALIEGNPVSALCDHARELTGRYKDRNGTKTTSERIQSGARQACLAARSIAQEVVQAVHGSRRNAMGWAVEWQSVHAVPVLVTTAVLYVCDFDARDVTLETGELPTDKARYDERPWVVYEHPLTGGLGFDPDELKLSRPLTFNFEALAKMQVIVVHAGSLGALAQRHEPLGQLLEGW